MAKVPFDEDAKKRAGKAPPTKFDPKADDFRNRGNKHQFNNKAPQGGRPFKGGGRGR